MITSGFARGESGRIEGSPAWRKGMKATMREPLMGVSCSCVTDVVVPTFSVGVEEQPANADSPTPTPIAVMPTR